MSELSPQVRAAVLAAIKKGFDPNEPRDAHGRWTESGAARAYSQQDHPHDELQWRATSPVAQASPRGYIIRRDARTGVHTVTHTDPETKETTHLGAFGREHGRGGAQRAAREAAQKHYEQQQQAAREAAQKHDEQQRAAREAAQAAAAQEKPKPRKGFVTTSIEDGKFTVQSPYYPDFVEDAKALNGRWSDGRWRFDARLESRVRALCLKHYGDDGSGEVPTVDVELHLDKISTSGQELALLGRILCKRRARDEAVRLGEGVAILAGGFSGAGGSARYPQISPLPGTVLQVFDVPLELARTEAEDNPEAFRFEVPESEAVAKNREPNVERAKTALQAYSAAHGGLSGAEPLETQVTELLSDLFHLLGPEELRRAIKRAEPR